MAQRVVMVLGGGGAKCIAHLGAWKAVVEWGGAVVHVLGTSMGAVMGAALATGATPEAVAGAAEALGAKDVAAVDLLGLVQGMFARSLLKRGALKATIGKLVPARSFSALKVPFTLTTTDMDTGELVLFGAPVPVRDSARHLGSDASLVDTLYASCALPVYFPAELVAGRRLADGGLRAVVPLELALRSSADLVLAIDVGPGFDEVAAPGPNSVPRLVRSHDEAMRIMMAAQTARVLAAWPRGETPLVTVRPVAEKNATFARGQTTRYFSAGYETTRRALATFGA